MSRYRHRRASIVAGAVALTVLLVAGGCGGGGAHVEAGSPGIGEPSSQGVGSLAVAVAFPPGEEKTAVEPSDLPDATRSVMLRVFDPQKPLLASPLVDPVVVTRQPGEAVVEATIEGVPVGDVLLMVEAFDVDDPLQAGAESIAEASVIVTVQASKTTRVDLVTNRLATGVQITGPTQVFVPHGALYVATAVDADGNPVLGTLVPQFSSSDPNIMVVSADGQTQPLQAGHVLVQCTARWEDRRDLQGSLAVTVAWPAPARIEVAAQTPDPSAPTHTVVDAGDTTALTATVYDATNTSVPGYPVTWASSNAAVADVNASGVVSGRQAGIVTITAQATDGVTTRSAQAEVVVMPSDSELLGHLQDAQAANGGFETDQGSGTMLGLHLFPNVAAAMRVLGGGPRDPNGLHTYMESLYRAGAHMYIGAPGGSTAPWPTQGAVRTYRLLQSVLPAFPHPDAVQALEQWAAAQVGGADCWGLGAVVTAVCSVYGATWSNADADRAAQGLLNSARYDGSYRIGEVLHTYWGVTGLHVLGRQPADPTATVNFLQNSQTAAGYFAKGPGRSDWDWLHEPAAVAGLYVLGADVPDPWAMKQWLAQAYANRTFGPSEPVIAYAHIALVKHLLARDPLALQLWREHNY